MIENIPSINSLIDELSMFDDKTLKLTIGFDMVKDPWGTKGRAVKSGKIYLSMSKGLKHLDKKIVSPMSLHKWVKAITDKYPNVEITDFTKEA